MDLYLSSHTYGNVGGRLVIERYNGKTASAAPSAVTKPVIENLAAIVLDAQPPVVAALAELPENHSGKAEADESSETPPAPVPQEERTVSLPRRVINPYFNPLGGKHEYGPAVLYAALEDGYDNPA